MFPRISVWIDGGGDTGQSAALAQPSARLVEVRRTDFSPHEASSSVQGIVETVLDKVGQERGLLWCPGEAGEQLGPEGLRDSEAGKQNSRKNSSVQRHEGWIEFIQVFTNSHCVLCSAQGDRSARTLPSRSSHPSDEREDSDQPPFDTR